MKWYLIIALKEKIFDLAVSFADSKIYLLPIAYIFLFFGALHISNFNKDNFISFLTFAMGIFLVFITPSRDGLCGSYHF